MLFSIRLSFNLELITFVHIIYLLSFFATFRLRVLRLRDLEILPDLDDNARVDKIFVYVLGMFSKHNRRTAGHLDSAH